MKYRYKGVILIGLGFSLLLALFLSPFSSTSPDGLENVARTKGFSDKGEGPNLWKFSPFSNYSIPWIKNQRVATALSGFIGTLAVFFIALGIGKLIRKIPPQKKLILFSFCFSLTLATPAAFADHPLITDDTNTQGKGRFRLELNGDVGFDKESEAGGRVKRIDGEVATILSYGIIDNLDVTVRVPFQWFRVKEDGETIFREKGLSDITLELKWRFYEKDGWSFAAKPGVTFPTGNERRDLGTGKVTVSIFAIVTKEIQPFSFHFNAGYARNENRLNELRDLWHFSLAAEAKVMKGLRLVSNIGVDRNPERSSRTPPAFILAGLIYSITDKFDVDIGIKGGLTKSATDLAILPGMNLRF